MGGVCSQLFAHILRSRQAQIISVCCFVIINVYLYYASCQRRKLSQSSKTFLQLKHGAEQLPPVVEPDALRHAGLDFIDKENTTPDAEAGQVSAGLLEINVVMPFTDVENKLDIQKKFRVCLESMLNYTSIPIAYHIIGDENSYAIAEQIMKKFQSQTQNEMVKLHRMVQLPVTVLALRLRSVVKTMQDRFSYKPGAYYSHALFFLSMALHKVLPSALDKVIMLDADLRFTADIKHLFAHFSLFKPSNIIGLANELQPVYRHTFQMYRDQHQGTPVGEPMPLGHPGYNSGVLLLHLDRMSRSKLYNDLLNPEEVEGLAKKYYFKGHLGDQDFFTLISMEHPELFYTLPCSWNRQLCRWWKDKGYDAVFDKYHNCTGPVYVYHGNCNTRIPAH